MSQERKHTKFGREKTAFKKATEYNRKSSIVNIVILILVLVTSVNCIAMLVLAAALYKKMEGLEDSIQAMQEPASQYMVAGQTSDSPMLEEEVVDVSEAVDLAEAAVPDYELVHIQDTGSSDGIRRVYLTFDDGPSANTDKILDVLDRYGVKATFFVVAKENYADQYRRIVEEGHTLAMHSFSHKYKEIYVSVDSYDQDLMKLHDYLYELTGKDCDIVRFPGGSSNKVSQVNMHELIAYLEERDIVYFDWNVSSGDASGHGLEAGQIVDNVLGNVWNFQNAVVLFHDASGKSSTVEALPIIIEKILEAENTVILPISRETVKVQHLQN